MIVLLEVSISEEEDCIYDMLVNCILFGVDEVVYVKVGWFVSVSKGKIVSSLVSREDVVRIFGIM